MNSICTGEMTITVDVEAMPPIQGRGTCEFDGVLSNLGEQEGLVDGWLDSSNLLGGGVWVGQDLQSAWDGGWDSFGSLQAGFKGDHEVSGIALTYRGAFEVWPEA
jgi:hypothetical protein